MQTDEDYEVLDQGSPVTKASKALIFMHGRGGTASGVIDFAKEFCDDQFYIAAPQAPHGVWYPYKFMDEEKLNEPSLSLSVEKIKKLIEEISKHLPKEKIYLMGFSQGACMALEVASRFADKYGGVVAFTGGLIGHQINEKKYQGHFKGTKVFIGNGDKDPYIPLIRSEESKELMEKMGAEVTLKVYPGRGHSISEEEISWVKQNIIL